MNNFGKLLRHFRLQSSDPINMERRLSQERLGELLGKELGGGFSGAAISDWERGISKIHADHRPVLLSLLKILARQGGIKTISDANDILEAGNYRSLNPSEIQVIFPQDDTSSISQSPLTSLKNRHWIISSVIEKILYFLSEEELRALLANAEEGPSPSWPRKVVTFLNKVLSVPTGLSVLKLAAWVWIFFLCWYSLGPSLEIPFASQDEAKLAITFYSGGSFVIPLLVGVQTTTKDTEFWRRLNLANSSVTRLYTYQGSYVGFHLGYFTIFFTRLFMFYFHLTAAKWLGLIAVMFLLIVCYAGARLVPYNLWQAYGRLKLADGRIFFFFVLLGPIWGFMLFDLHTILLTPTTGVLAFFVATTIFALSTAWRHRRKKSVLQHNKDSEF